MLSGLEDEVFVMTKVSRLGKSFVWITSHTSWNILTKPAACRFICFQFALYFLPHICILCHNSHMILNKVFFLIHKWKLFSFIIAYISMGCSLLCVDCNCAVWREAIQLSTSGPGKVDVVCFPRAGRARLGTGNMQAHLFLFSLFTCFYSSSPCFTLPLCMCTVLYALNTFPFDLVLCLLYGLGDSQHTQ